MLHYHKKNAEGLPKMTQLMEQLTIAVYFYGFIYVARRHAIDTRIPSL